MLDIFSTDIAFFFRLPLQSLFSAGMAYLLWHKYSYKFQKLQDAKTWLNPKAQTYFWLCIVQVLNAALYLKLDTFLYGVMADLALSLAGLTIAVRYRFISFDLISGAGIVNAVQPLWGIIVDSVALSTAYAKTFWVDFDVEDYIKQNPHIFSDSDDTDSPGGDDSNIN